MTEQHEEWRVVPGFPRYQASNLGRIKSFKSHGERILNPGKSKGYPTVTLTTYNLRKTFSVHRIVWLAFNGEISEGLEINHIDGNRGNAALSNLEAISHQDNIRHAVNVLGRKLGRRMTFTPEQIAEAQETLRQLELRGIIRYPRTAPTDGDQS